MEKTDKFLEQIIGIKRPWFIKDINYDIKNKRVDVYLDHEKNIEFVCPICHAYCSIYDHAPERVLRHLNIMQITTYIHIRVPRVSCKKDGVQQIIHGLGEPNSTITYEFERLIIDLEQECSIESICRMIDIDWHLCQRIQEKAVERGKALKGNDLPVHIAVDEKSFAKGHKYETIICDSDKGTVEAVIDKRDQSSLESYLKEFTFDQRKKVETITMDMWDPYIAAVKEYIPNALEKIVFDRFHVTKVVNNAVDNVRKQENSELIKVGIETLKGTKHLWLYNEENIPEYRREEFNELKSLDLKVCRAQSIKENLRNMWNYNSSIWMRKFFKDWYFWATHSRLKPMIKAVKTLNSHLDNIVTYAKHKATNAISESINSKIEKVKRLACGYRNREHYRIAIMFHCGGLDLYPKRKNIALQVI